MIKRIKLLWWQFRETRDQAWHSGYQQSEEDGEEDRLSKEAWIAECEYAITEMLGVLTNEQWQRLPVDVQEHLRNHI